MHCVQVGKLRRRDALIEHVLPNGLLYLGLRLLRLISIDSVRQVAASLQIFGNGPPKPYCNVCQHVFPSIERGTSTIGS